MWSQGKGGKGWLREFFCLRGEPHFNRERKGAGAEAIAGGTVVKGNGTGLQTKSSHLKMKKKKGGLSGVKRGGRESVLLRA